jgi:serine phosphatase RsbU (regulator of sigma subunit)
MFLLPYLPFIFLLLAIAADGVRTLGRKAWLLLTPGLLWACYLIFFELVVASSRRFVLAADLLAACVPLAVLIIFLMRFTEQQREHVRLVDDMKQAQEVQQVLLPEELPQIAGLTIESEYRPAREVGGDFFQIVPQTTDGSVLIVVGDVTGKGLQAGMLVALIVGAIRTQAETSSVPLRVLQALNRRLCGRAHATCLALRIEPDGRATLANAGHLPPYLNGNELQIEGALPLGMVEGAEFSVMQFQLAPGDRLMLLSDGIAEALDKHGQLFGFERIQAMLQTPVTAAAIATAAQNFGQEDDISVLSVTRIADMKAVTA